jgi:hypothetical protein
VRLAPLAAFIMENETRMIGFGKRFSYAFRCFFSLLGSGTIPPDVAEETVSPPVPSALPAPAKPTVEPPDRAIQLLALLQREGRLVDFVSEDIAAYSDEQVGAAVRAVHEGCRVALDRYLTLEPVVNEEEDRPTTVQPGFDPASIKLIGNVGSTPPFRGTLRHRGWRVTKTDLPPLPEGQGRVVVAPAEVEIA